MSLDNIRIGKCYFIRNHGESTSFVALESIGENDFKIKDLLSLEIYPLSQLIKYGFGNDFELRETEC
ncbi:MAG TPA: hypothetical protein DDY13_12425 [Cytophagales bacterium]|jgi:hypothetical protein|nr:hypothetical protein [Cytophagales bacterium]